MTMRTPSIRVKEMYTTAVPMPFVIEIEKKVYNPREKEAMLHTLLEAYTERYPRREFFRASIEDVRMFFRLVCDPPFEINTRKYS